MSSVVLGNSSENVPNDKVKSKDVKSEEEIVKLVESLSELKIVDISRQKPTSSSSKDVVESKHYEEIFVFEPPSEQPSEPPSEQPNELLKFLEEGTGSVETVMFLLETVDELDSHTIEKLELFFKENGFESED